MALAQSAPAALQTVRATKAGYDGTIPGPTLRVKPGDTLMSGSHSLWGWLYIGIGAVFLLLAPLVFARNPAGVFLAIVAIACNALTHLLGFGHRISWSIVALVLDGLVLFALLNYGFRVRDNRQRADAAR